jgi:hypothetical protein
MRTEGQWDQRAERTHHEDRDRRRRSLRPRRCTPAPSRARNHRVRGRRPCRRPCEHDPRRHAERDAPRRHRLHRLQRSQLPELRAPARAPRGRVAALVDDVQRQRRHRRLRIQRCLSERPVREARPPRDPVVSPDDRRPRAIQLRGARSAARSRRGTVTGSLARRGAILASAASDSCTRASPQDPRSKPAIVITITRSSSG